MFVFIKNECSEIFDVFGPATPGECESWMKLKRIHPRETTAEIEPLVFTALEHCIKLLPE